LDAVWSQHGSSPSEIPFGTFRITDILGHTVDGRNPATQLKLIVYPMVYRVLATSQVVGLGISESSKVFQYTPGDPKYSLHNLLHDGRFPKNASSHGQCISFPPIMVQWKMTLKGNILVSGQTHFPLSKKKSGGGKK